MGVRCKRNLNVFHTFSNHDSGCMFGSFLAGWATQCDVLFKGVVATICPVGKAVYALAHLEGVMSIMTVPIVDPPAKGHHHSEASNYSSTSQNTRVSDPIIARALPDTTCHRYAGRWSEPTAHIQPRVLKNIGHTSGGFIFHVLSIEGAPCCMIAIVIIFLRILSLRAATRLA